MIVKLELEAFRNRIESKLDALSGANKQSALDNINILNRAIIELKESNDILRKSMRLNTDVEIQSIKAMIELEELKKENRELKQQLITKF